MTSVSLNWCPKTFEEFRQAATGGQVELNILPEHYNWLYDNIMPWKPWLYFLGFGSYKERLVRLMTTSERIFWSVHNKGIDLVRTWPKEI